MTDNKVLREENTSVGNAWEEEFTSCGNDIEEENTSRGNGWEVVSLTSSVYAAASGPRDLEYKYGKERDTYIENELSRALFMSGHFVFPPSEHENLPLEPINPDKSEICNENVGKDSASVLGVQESSRSSGKDEDYWNLKCLNTVPDEEYAEVKLSDKKSKNLSFHGTEFEEGDTLQGLNLTEKEPSLYSSYASELDLGNITAYSENTTTPEMNEVFEQGADIPYSELTGQKDRHSAADLPCEAWWKRRVLSLYSHAKESNTFWSIFVSAAVMGLVILGHRWQQERWQALYLKWQHSIRNEGCMMSGSISRLKDVVVGSHRGSSFPRGIAPSDY